ncbi:cysteine peptidase family C39 domain-containing protein [Bacillus cereus]|uniref:hypothetical protein n=1 Tax=Bacillus cereus TaxID=1396 RepID=UPI00384CC5E3
MNKILPVNENCVVNCYHFESFPLAIISNYEEATPWINSNYIQLCMHKDFLTAPVPFKFYIFDYAIVPWLKTQRLDREIFPLMNRSIVDFVKDAIKQDYYVYLNVDEYFIPNRRSYKTQHFSHDLLVFGFEDSKNEFKILGYDHNFKYRTTEVSYSEFKKGFLNLDNIKNCCPQIYLYKFNKDVKYNFNIEVVIDFLEDYLFCVRTSKRYDSLAEPEDLVFGLECYDYLQLYLSTLLDSHNQADVRMFHKLLEHKLCMLNRIEFLQEKKYIDIESDIYLKYKDIANQALIAKTLIIKYNMTKNFSCIESARERLTYIKKYEKIIIFELLKIIKKDKGYKEIN